MLCRKLRNELFSRAPDFRSEKTESLSWKTGRVNLAINITCW